MKHWILTTGIAVALLLGASAWSQETDRQRAIEAVRSGNPAEAADIYRSLLEKDDSDPSIRRDLMWLLWELERYPETAEQTGILLQSVPDDFEALEMAARSHHRMGELEEALSLYRRALQVQPDQAGLQLEIVRLFETQKEYARAQEAMNELREMNPDLPEADPVQARLLEMNGLMDEAAEYWSRAHSSFPGNIDYAFREARALQLAGHQPEAATKMRSLLEDHPGHQPAREWLIDIALMNGRVDEAIELLSTRSWSGTPTDVPHRLRLAALNNRIDQHQAALEQLKKAGALAPHHPEVRVMQAETLQQLEQWQASISASQQAIELNPASQRARLALAAAFEALEQSEPALDAVISTRLRDPTSPTLLVRESRSRFLAGQTNAAENLLLNWLAEQDPGSVEVPVLVYHGIANSDRDPMLASKLHMTRDQFERQIRGLHQAGFQSITMDQMRNWLNGGKSLPEQPVLITFDDGRLDSITNATPVLEETGFQAVMFVAGVNAGRNLPGYANWDELAGFQAGPVWSLQSHGDEASYNISVSSNGLTGKFLANRQWLTGVQRLESIGEWRDRIRADYQSIRDQLETLTGAKPLAHAWPEGNYGQQSMVNVSEAAETNLQLTRDFFDLGFHQGGTGVNTVHRDPILLERFEPDPEWNGEQLIQQFASRSPGVLVVRELLAQALWRRDATSARKWFDQLRQLPHAPGGLGWEAARIAFLEDDYEKAGQLGLELLEAAPSQSTEEQVRILNFLTSVHLAAGDGDKARETCRASLELDPDQPGAFLDLATLYELQRQYDRSLEICMRLRETHPDFDRVLPFLGRLHEHRKEHAEAARWWDQAATAFPENLDYAFLALKNRYLAGEHAQAIAALNQWLSNHPDHQEARTFLIQCALVRNDDERALELLIEQRDQMKTIPASLRRQIAGHYLNAGKLELALQETRLAIESNPEDGESRLLFAELLHRAGRTEEAEELFQSIAEQNLASRRAWLGWSDSLFELGRTEEALTALRHLRGLEPNDPTLLLREAGYVYSASNTRESHDLLQNWFNQQDNRSLPVLCYHGLTTDPMDPMLARPFHHTVATFEDHLKALHSAGYATVTAQQAAGWHSGRDELPDKAVMITFDDGRLDSFRHADPLLEQYGFNAVMFVDGRNASRNLPGYATWDELKAYQETGRWDLQSHGTLSSSRVQLDRDGNEGKFLVSLQWKESEASKETVGEWETRIRKEHQETAARMEQELGVTPVAFAWPEGDYGQEGIPGFPQTAMRNLELANESYQLAYHQDAFGINLRSQNRMLLNRLEPPQDWTGNELLRHLQDERPQSRIAYQLLRQSAWLGRTHEGYRWLDTLEDLGVSTERLTISQALLRTLSGDAGHAQMLLNEGTPEVRAMREYDSLMESIEDRQTADGRFTFEAWRDNDDRQTLSGRLSGSMPAFRSTRIHLEAGVSEYHEDNLDTSLETAAKVTLQNQLNAFHRFDAGVGGHLFSGPGQDMVSFSARWDASWSDDWRTGLGWEYLPGYTVEALIEDIRFHRGRVDGYWTPRDDIDVRLAARYWDYSDSNTRVDATAQLGYDLPWIDHLTGLYRLTLADTQDEVPAYYTPQELIQNQAGAEYLWRPTENLAWRFRYLFGYGHEQGDGGRIVHAAHTDVLFRNVGGLNLRPSLDYQQTPAYRMFHVMLTVDWQF